MRAEQAREGPWLSVARSGRLAPSRAWRRLASSTIDVPVMRRGHRREGLSGPSGSYTVRTGRSWDGSRLHGLHLCWMRDQCAE
jgi:hypothetical protein